MFLGYSPNQKGYRCLYPPSGKVFTSRHVIFDEDLFPFKAQFKNLVPRYRTALLQAWQSATASPDAEPLMPTTRVLPTTLPSTAQTDEQEVEQQ